MDYQERRSAIARWVSDQPVTEALASALQIISYPATIEQNHVLDVVEQIIGDHPAVTRERWIPDWDEVSRLTSPLDDQNLYIDVAARNEAAYAEVLPHLEVAVYAIRRGDGPTLMLNGHVDVVPVDNQDWTSNAFAPSVRGGLMIARGAMDMKAGLIAAAYTFRYLADNWDGEGTLLFAVVPEEETGGNGTLATLARGYVPDAVIFTEPTDLEVVHRHVGIQAFSVDVVGRPGGMLKLSWGDSAAPALARAAIALEKLEEERTARAHAGGGYAEDDLPGFINFVMASGDWLATRAADGHIDGLMGVLPGETQQQAEDELRAAVHAATRLDKTPVHVKVHAGGHRGSELPGGHHLVQSFVDPHAVGEHGPGRPTTAGTMVCDAKIVQGGGWAPAVVLGPIGGNLHAADEWVDLRSVSHLIELVVVGVQRYFD